MSLFKDLSVKYNIIYNPKIEKEFDKYKDKYIEYKDDNILDLYKLSFFYIYNNLKVNKKEYCKKYKYDIFKRCVEEVKGNYKEEEYSKGGDEEYKCNLYSMLN